MEISLFLSSQQIFYLPTVVTRYIASLLSRGNYLLTLLVPGTEDGSNSLLENDLVLLLTAGISCSSLDRLLGKSLKITVCLVLYSCCDSVVQYSFLW